MIVKQNKNIAMLLVIMLIIPIFWNQNTAIALAATPTFKKSKVEIVGAGEVYQLAIKDMVKGSTYSWSSSNTKVAKVSKKGIVTSVNKGTATIKCKITYPSKKTKTLSCKVTVVIPATSININNSNEVNGTHVMTLGTTMDFNTELVPANTSDKVFWSIAGGDSACISIVNSADGIVTATKAGKVILKATAAKTSSKSSAESSIINDAVIIEVVGPTATVKSADITNSNEITVVFDSPVNANTVIGLNNKLSSNIEITLRKDTKGVLAKDPGTLTASLSTDGKTLIITSANSLSGEYGINFSSSILTTSGIALESYYKSMSFIDVVPPTIADISYDDSTMISTIKFSEVIDFTNFKVASATIVTTSGATANSATISTLATTSNYIISADKKSVSINLSKIATTDLGKIFAVTFTGIKDMAGNAPASYTLTAYLEADNSLKPQAVPMYIVRSSYNTLTATFNRAIRVPGYISIAGGSTISGVVDSTDSKKVNYTLTSAETSYTGIKSVSIGYWDSYNVFTTDTSAQQMKNFNVDFTADKTSPTLSTYVYDATTGILTLTYNEDVILGSSSGIFSATVVTATDDIKNGYNVSYTNVIHTEGANIIKLKLSNMTLAGTYTFVMDSGFVKDNFNNACLSRSLSISNTSSEGLELPGPYLISQSSSNLSQIVLEFAHKLDVTSAQTISNYTIAGATITSAVVTKNTTDTGATVVLTVAEGTLDVTVARPITIKGVRGYASSYGPISAYTTTIELKDNKKPYFIDPPVFDTTSYKVIKLNFSEEIKGSLEVKVTQIVANGSTPIEFTSTVAINGSTAYITLGSTPVNNTYMKIEILTNTLKDVSGNSVSAMPSTLGLYINY